MDWTSLIEMLIAAIGGGGLVRLFMIPEKKSSAKLDNAERVIAKYEEILKKYERRISELESEVRELKAAALKETDARDRKIATLQARVYELETKLHQVELTAKPSRDKHGRFQKQV